MWQSGRCCTDKGHIVPVLFEVFSVILHCTQIIKLSIYSYSRYGLYFLYGPCDVRPPVQPEYYGLKLKMTLKLSDIYTETIYMYGVTNGPS